MPNIFINETEIVGEIFLNISNNITGSIFLTGVMFLILMFVIASILRLPLELTGIFLLPIILIFMAFNTGWVAIGGIFLIYLAVVVARNFFIR